MKLPEIKPSPNGKYEAPPPSSGAFIIQSPRTEFPSDQLPLSLPILLYNCSHFWFAGASLLRWLTWLFVLVAVTTILWHWWIAVLWLVVLAAALTALVYWQRHDFVSFTAEPLPQLPPQPLTIQQKVPVFVTGRFNVEDKWQRYTWLPGFYRTFATRERALLCRVQNQSFLRISHWSEAAIGLWYIFFMPDQVQQVRWGRLAFGKTTRPALAITYRSKRPNAKRADDVREENIYLAVQTAEDGYKILTDLTHDLPTSVFTPKPSAQP